MHGITLSPINPGFEQIEYTLTTTADEFANRDYDCVVIGVRVAVGDQDAQLFVADQLENPPWKIMLSKSDMLRLHSPRGEYTEAILTVIRKTR